MDGSVFLAILSLVFIMLSSIKFYRLRNEFKKLRVGDTLSDELVDESRKKIRGAITLLGIGCILSLVVVLI